jgi:hypothetical protein
VPHFIYDTVTLPFPKVNKFPVPTGANPSNYVRDVDWNALCQALTDIRDAHQDAKYYGLNANTADPAPVGLDAYLYARDTNALYLKNGAGTFRLDRPLASLVDYAGGSTWADSTTNPATTVELQLDKIVGDLSGAAGLAKVGAAVTAGSPYSLSAGTAKAQVDSLLSSLNAHANSSSAHTAANLTYAGSPAWADLTTVAAGSIQSGIDGIVTALGTGNGGAKIAVGTEPSGIGGFGLITTTVKAQINELLGHINLVAVAASYDGGPNWADGVTNPATTIGNQLDKIIVDLSTGDGTGKIHGNAVNGTGLTVVSVTAATLTSQIQQILTHIGNGAAGLATGDLTGSYPGPTVAKIRGVNVLATAPTLNQVLQYDGSDWKPATISTAPSGSATGDLSASYPNPTVAKIQNVSVHTAAPTDKQGLIFDNANSRWAPFTQAMDCFTVVAGLPNGTAGPSAIEAIGVACASFSAQQVDFHLSLPITSGSITINILKTTSAGSTTSLGSIVFGSTFIFSGTGNLTGSVVAGDLISIQVSSTALSLSGGTSFDIAVNVRFQ